MNDRHRSHPPTRRLDMASRRSVGIAWAPAITLNRMYHCAPSAMSTTAPKFSEIPAATNSAVANGNTKLAGKLASTCTTGWARRVIFGFIPIHTPTGTQTTVATAISTTTRANVAAPSSRALPNAPSPTVACTYRSASATPSSTIALTTPAKNTSPVRCLTLDTSSGYSASPNGRVTRSSTTAAGLNGLPSRRGTDERRSTSSIRLRGRSADPDSSIRNRSDQAVSGRQNTAFTPIAMPTWPKLPAAIAAAAYEPIPGSAYWWFRTLIDSDAARKNQAPPKLI